MFKKCLLLFLLFFASEAFGSDSANGLYFNSISRPHSSGSQQVSASKVGTGVNTAYLGLVSIGDATVEKIAKENGIRNVVSVERSNFSIFGIYSTETFTVYGN